MLRELLPGAAHLCSRQLLSPTPRSLSQVLTFQWPVQEASCLRSHTSRVPGLGLGLLLLLLLSPQRPQPSSGASCPTFEELGVALADRAECLLHRHLLLCPTGRLLPRPYPGLQAPPRGSELHPLREWELAGLGV